MTRPRISLATCDFRKPLKACLRPAAETGATGLLFDFRREVTSRDFGDTAIRQVLHLTGEYGLQVLGGVFPLRLSLHEPTHLDQRLSMLTEAMALCRRFKGKLLSIPSGSWPAIDSEEEVRWIEAVEALAEAGNRLGVTPCLSIVRERPDRVQHLFSQIKSGPVEIEIDPLLWMVQGSATSPQTQLRLSELVFAEPASSAPQPVQEITIEALLRTCSDWIGHVQARDGRWLGEGLREELPLGAGEVDWPVLLALLHEAAYRGWLTVRATGAPDVFAELFQAVGQLYRWLGLSHPTNDA